MVGRGALAAGSLVVVLALGSHLYFLAFEILFQVFHKRIQIIASHMKPIVLVFILMKGVNSKATYFLPHIHIGFWSTMRNVHHTYPNQDRWHLIQPKKVSQGECAPFPNQDRLYRIQPNSHHIWDPRCHECVEFGTVDSLWSK